MKKLVTLATAGIFLFTLQGARAQKEVAPPAIPPMLEGQRPLAQPETKEPAAPKKIGEDQAKPKAKAKKSKSGKTAQKKAQAKKSDKKKPSKVVKKKGQKNHKIKRPAVEPMAGPEEG